jgi:hypothetical protein
MTLKTDITYPQKRLITILVCILMAVIAYRTFIQPDIKKLELLDMEYDTAVMSLDLLEENLDSADSIQLNEMLTQAQQEYNSAKTDIYQLMPPDETSLAVNSIFSDCGIVPSSMQIGEPDNFSYENKYGENIVSDMLYFSDVSVSFTASFMQTKNFISIIDSSPFLSINSFEMSYDSNNTVSVKMTLYVYMYDEYTKD